MADVELYLNATYAQHLAVKSVYEKIQYVIYFPLNLGQCLN